MLNPETPEFPVNNTWMVYARGIDGRFYGVVADPQQDFEHALHLVEAYTTPESWEDEFEPDAVCIRDGSAVHMLRALQAVVAWADSTGSSGDIIDAARKAVAMAIDPMLPVGSSVMAYSFEEIRISGIRGAEAHAAGKTRADNPYAANTLLHQGWDRGWEQDSIRIQ